MTITNIVTGTVGNSATVPKDAEIAWEDVRGDTGIQFERPSTPPPPEPSEIPQWMQDVGEWVRELFAPMADGFAGFWYVAQYVLIGLLVVGIVVLLYKIFKPIIDDWLGREKDEVEDLDWRPDSEVARSLLNDADILAEKGDYSAAIRLILHRSIADIAKANPRAVMPSDTSREIGRFEILPEAARQVFGTIAGHVERGVFAGQSLDRTVWEESRQAYGRFALGGKA